MYVCVGKWTLGGPRRGGGGGKDSGSASLVPTWSLSMLTRRHEPLLPVLATAYRLLSEHCQSTGFSCQALWGTVSEMGSCAVLSASPALSASKAVPMKFSGSSTCRQSHEPPTKPSHHQWWTFWRPTEMSLKPWPLAVFYKLPLRWELPGLLKPQIAGLQSSSAETEISGKETW